MKAKKCKRIPKHTVKKDITIGDYRDTLISSLEKKEIDRCKKRNN